MNIELPKQTRKCIVVDDNGIGQKIVYLVGYCPLTLAYYNALFTDAQKYFTNLDPEKAFCGKVRESAFILGYTLMIIPIENKKYSKIAGFETVKWEDLRIQSYQ